MTDVALLFPKSTARLHFRFVMPTDSTVVTEAVRDPRVHRMLARVPPNQTRAQTLAWIATHEAARLADTDHVFALIHGEMFAGVIGAHRALTTDPFEIGYWLVPDAWGKGLCTEAGFAIIGWLEQTRGARALVSGYFVDNAASGRVLRKLGFMPCGRQPMFSAGRGEAADHFQMARIATNR